MQQFATVAFLLLLVAATVAVIDAAKEDDKEEESGEDDLFETCFDDYLSGEYETCRTPDDATYAPGKSSSEEEDRYTVEEFSCFMKKKKWLSDDGKIKFGTVGKYFAKHTTNEKLQNNTRIEDAVKQCKKRYDKKPTTDKKIQAFTLCFFDKLDDMCDEPSGKDDEAAAA